MMALGPDSGPFLVIGLAAGFVAGAAIFFVVGRRTAGSRERRRRWESRLHRLEAEIAGAVATHRRLEAERGAALAERDRATAAVRQLLAEIDDRRATIERLEAELAATAAERDRAASAIAARDAALVERARELARAEAAWEAERAALALTREEDLEAAGARFDQLAITARAAREELEAALAVAAGKLKDRERQLALITETREAEASRLAAALAEAAEATRRQTAAEAAHRAAVLAHQEELARLAAESGALAASVERVEPLRRQVADREELIRAVGRERDDAIAALVKQERLHAADTERMTALAAERDRAQAELAVARSEVSRLEHRIADVLREHDELTGSLRRATTRIETLTAEMRDRDRRFRALLDDRRRLVETNQNEVGRLRAELATARFVPDPLPAPRENGDRPDDLKRIIGIGPAIERVLNDQGITTFRQIAEWSDDDIARVGRGLGAFGFRIRRDRWVEQARREHERAHGEAID